MLYGKRMKNLSYYLMLAFSCAAVLAFTSCHRVNNVELLQPQTRPVTAITQTSARSGGAFSPNSHSEIVSKGVCWSQEANPTLADNFTEEGGGIDPFESTLTGLLPENEYHVRAYGTNSAGTAYGEDLTFKTLGVGSTSQIIADHTVVDRYYEIPQQLIDSV